MSIPVPTLTEEQIKRALIESQGDLWIASQALGNYTVVQLDRFIRVSEELQRTVLAIRQTKVDPEYQKWSAEQARSAVESRLSLYQADGLDALHQIATMPLSDNSAQNQVKLAAAARLAGNRDTADAGPSDLAQTLEILNREYQENAPKIKSIRERIVTFESEPKLVNP